MKKENKIKGVAALFDQIEIKVFLKNYLIFLGIVEAIIFFVCFVEQLGSGDTPFPWKNYFFAAFIIPVIITFLFGILVAGFNKYLYGSSDYGDESQIIVSDREETPNYIKKIEELLALFQKLPFLLTLFILTLTAGVIYKLDSIIAFITATGQKSLEYLVILLGTLIGIGTLFGLIWLILNYKLRKKSIEYKHSYKENVIKQLGMVILDDDTVLDKDGKVISQSKKNKRGHHFRPSFHGKKIISNEDIKLIKESDKKEDDGREDDSEK